ncbi:hypothetical protein ANDSL2ph1_CDS0037 [Acetoanaerobium phage ANDSL2_ph1]
MYWHFLSSSSLVSFLLTNYSTHKQNLQPFF